MTRFFRLPNRGEFEVEIDGFIKFRITAGHVTETRPDPSRAVGAELVDFLDLPHQARHELGLVGVALAGVSLYPKAERR